MSQINPFVASIFGIAQVQRASTDKSRHAQELAKDSALQGDQFEHQVESADALHASSDDSNSREPPPDQQQNRNPDAPEQESPEEDRPRIDLTA